MPTSHNLGAKALVLALLAGSTSALGVTPGDDEFNFGKPEISRWRVGFNAGVVTPADIDPTLGEGVIEYKDGYLAGAHIGYHLGSLSERMALSLELEALFSESDIDSEGIGTNDPTGENTSTAAGMLNAVVDWRLNERVTLSLGLGAGFAVVDLDELSTEVNPYKLGSGQESTAAFQGKVGLNFDMGSGAAWTLGYRYFHADEIEAKDQNNLTYDFTNELHSFELGIRFDL
ncbi:MAG: opacity protein-like surface antigen [Planctomycetota bacterium]|jgi:opacity protein-like surface antigen